MRNIALIALAVALASCGGKSGKKADAPQAPQQTAPTTTTPPAGPQFADVNAILKDKCALCHNPADADSFIDNEANLKSAAADISTRIQATGRGKMPMMRTTVALTAAEVQTFLVFLGKAQAAPGATAPTFETDITPIVAAKCARCHGDASFAPGKFVGHEDKFKAMGDAIAASVTATSSYEVMPPPANDRALSDAEKAVILGYFAL